MPVRQAPAPQQPARPAAPAPAPAPQQQHAMTSAPAPTTPAVAQPQPQQPGLFAQMASTAAGVAVGSAVGHTVANGISSLFGGSSDKPVEPAPAPAAQPTQYQAYQPQQQFQPGAGACEADAKAFTKCLENNNNDVSACQWYLDALKSCQQMASQY